MLLLIYFSNKKAIDRFYSYNSSLYAKIKIILKGEKMKEKIEFLRKMNLIIVPFDFTYFHHSTSYISPKIKERMTHGKYMRNWTSLPLNEFVIKGEMSFVERDDRIKETFDYRKPLSEANIIYNLPDYSKPFCIRVIIPKIDSARKDILPISAEYKKEFEKIYRGYGDGRHPKLKGGEKIILIGTSMTDEVSGKIVDIFYGVRECDIELYYNCVMETIKNGYSIDANVNLLSFDKYGRYTNFYPQSYSIEKSSNMNRYIGSPSEFEMELFEDYKDDLNNNDSELPRINNHYKYYKLYNNYGIGTNVNKKTY